MFPNLTIFSCNEVNIFLLIFFVFSFEENLFRVKKNSINYSLPWKDFFKGFILLTLEQPKNFYNIVLFDYPYNYEITEFTLDYFCSRLACWRTPRRGWERPPRPRRLQVSWVSPFTYSCVLLLRKLRSCRPSTTMLSRVE